MANIARVEFDVGKTIHGQPLRLVLGRSTGGQREWTLYRDAADQRDDSVFIGGLTKENIEQMAAALKIQIT